MTAPLLITPPTAAVATAYCVRLPRVSICSTVLAYFGISRNEISGVIRPTATGPDGSAAPGQHRGAWHGRGSCAAAGPCLIESPGGYLSGARVGVERVSVCFRKNSGFLMRQ